MPAIFRSCWLVCLLPLTLLAPVFVYAGASTSVSAAAGASSAPVSVTSPLQMVLALLFVLALIFVLVWLVRRLQFMPGNQRHGLRVVSALPVGTREKVLLIDVHGKQLLLGVTPGSINLLHSFDIGQLGSLTSVAGGALQESRSAFTIDGIDRQ